MLRGHKMINDFRCYEILDCIPDPLIIFDKDYSVAYANRTFEIMSGYKKEDILNTKPPFPWFDGKEFGVLNKNMDNYSAKEKLFSKSDGEKIWVEVTDIFLTDKNNNKIIIESWKNINKRKNAENTLMNYQQQLNLLSNHLEFIREKERKKIAQEIHDELGQILTVLKMDLFWTLKKIPEEFDNLVEKSKSMIQLIDDAIKSVQRISLELRPRLLDDFGLVEAIDWQVRQFIEVSDINCEIIEMPENIDMEQESAIAFYRIIQEILTNIVRHSQATCVKLSLTLNDESLTLTVTDNGRGMPEEMLNDPKALGIIGIRERIKYLNGRFNVSSNGNGTNIKVIIPLNRYKEQKID